MDKEPFISVIVPTYNRPERLALCLGALARSAYPSDWFEVVVVDDGQPYYLVPWGELWPASDWALTSLDLSAW